MAGTDQSLQVKDVYDCACDIFQEFEKIITITGIEDASMLITKVKNVLELLEDSVKKIEQLNKDYAELKSKCSLLSCDKLAKEEETRNLKQSFEDLEESWTQESLNLKSLITKLKAENKILHHRLAEKKDIPPEVDSAFKTIIEDQENLISKLKSNLMKKDTKLEQDQITIEMLNAEIDHLRKVNNSLHLRYQEANEIIVAFKQEKSESEVKLNLQNEKLHYLEENLDDLKKSIAEKCEFSLQNMLDIYKPSCGELDTNKYRLKTLFQEQKKLKQEVKDLKLELTLLKIQMDEYKKEISNADVIQNHERVEGHGHFDQIFRLFLGVFAVNPQICLLRKEQMYAL